MTRRLAQRLCLGTATFGLDYGVANTTGQIAPQDVYGILETSLAAGVDTWDTAVAYGTSERVLGDFLQQTEQRPAVISKLPTEMGKNVSSTVEQVVHGSLERLNLNQLYGYLIHDFDDFSRDERIVDALLALQKKGVIKKVGFSLYLPSQLETLLEKGIPFDIVQVPYSLFDRRFSGLFPELCERGIEIHVRSVFLQGLMFLEPDILSGSLVEARPRVDLLRLIAADNGLSVGAIALNYVLGNPWLDKVVLGVDTLSQLQQSLGWLAWHDRVLVLEEALTPLATDNEMLVLPYKWVTS